MANSAWPAIIFWADLLADYWSSLTECVRTGESAASLRPEIMKRWQEEPEGPAMFRAVMGTSPAESYQPIARSWDFSDARMVADLGGGGGAMIEAILETFPKVCGMLVDRPASIDAAKPRFSLGPVAVVFNLSQPICPKRFLTGADVHVLKHVLHGYADDAAAQILRNCRAALPDDGRILIVEFVLPEVIDGADPDLEKRLLSDLNMLAVTGGKERNTLNGACSWHARACVAIGSSRYLKIWSLSSSARRSSGRMEPRSPHRARAHSVMSKVNCGQHGLAGMACVCVHAAVAIDTGEPVGFYFDELEGPSLAWCHACNRDQSIRDLNSMDRV